ncbi:MAG: carboxypeptidase family protein [Enterobacterales bacterium]|nr:carboxypeptidase family protein [Enterobacterales bacterium]
MHITCQFDGGNIDVLDASQVNNIRLNIRKDNESDFYQWFHFKVHSEANVTHCFKIENAAGSAYVQGWEGYQAVASYDRDNWFRVPTSYTDGQLVIEHLHEEEVIYYAYFAPYTYERHMDLLMACQESHLVRLEHLGETLDGRDMTLVNISTESDVPKKKVWVIARQHPGETMAEWLVEGMLARLLDEDDPVARSLLEVADFYIVPNMNPDGGYRGHLRTNAVGANLNREWLTPTMTRSPEVYLVREKMLATGVDMFLDIHGDEAIPYNFLAGCEGIPAYDAAFDAKQQRFIQDFLNATPDFQIKHGYPKSAPGQANLTMATTWVGEQFGCISFTLEMPFKDNLDLPDELYGWSPERCVRLGEALCMPILDSIRD